jgi:CheY-like chemotaxis protein
MFAGPLQILMIEDNPADAKLLEYELRRGGIEFESVRVETEPEFLAALNRKLDVVLCDWQLPQFDCLQALTILQASQPSVPFIVVSGSLGEEAAVDAMKLGVSDYLLKDRLGRLIPAVQQALEKREIQLSADRATQALRLSESRLTEAQRIARLGSWEWEPESGKIWWSDTMFALLGLNPATSEPTLETFLSVLHPDDRHAALRRTVAMQAAYRNVVDCFDQRANPGTSGDASPDDSFFFRMTFELFGRMAPSCGFTVVLVRREIPVVEPFASRVLTWTSPNGNRMKLLFRPVRRNTAV